MKGIVTEKHLRRDIGVIPETLKKSEISSVKWVEKKYQLADCLTKKGASTSNLLQVFSEGKLPQQFADYMLKCHLECNCFSNMLQLF